MPPSRAVLVLYEYDGKYHAQTIRGPSEAYLEILDTAMTSTVQYEWT